MTASPYPLRLARVREAMASRGIDALLLSLGADLPWLTGYTAMPLERLTMLVVPGPGAAQLPVLVVPELEAPRARPVPEVFSLHPWSETEDPVALVSGLLRPWLPARAAELAISDRTWATFVLRLQAEFPHAAWHVASEAVADLRAVKDHQEIEALSQVAAAADRVADALLTGDVALVGRTERQVSAELSRRLLDEGHDRVNFAIVASGPNSASPHHEPSSRVIQRGEAVVCDFGGSMDGYCSDITRTVFTGPPPSELGRIYEVVAEAQAAGVAAARVGRPCSEVDRACRRVISEAGFGPYFVHRTGHGIGLEEHEGPYIVEGNDERLAGGNVFSVEPGIYVPGLYGVRIEDIVAATGDGPRPLNLADHSLTVVGG